MLFTEFMKQEKRIPMIENGDQPWNYRGWLLYYIQKLHAHPRCTFPDRWGYLMRIKMGLPTGSIEHVRYNQPCKDAIKNLDSCMEIISQENKHRWWGNFIGLIDWLAFATGVSNQESNLNQETQKNLYQTFDAGLWLQTPYDYLGDFICAKSGNGWNPHAFYPTPHEMVELLVKMKIDTSKETKWQSLHDPCLGTGRILMHGGNYCLRLYGQDIDSLMVRISKINGVFFVPWMVVPVAESDRY